MFDKLSLSNYKVALREAAEKHLLEMKFKSKSLRDRKAQHELEVFQIELEMQNIELMDSKKAQEFLLRRYTELFEFAPVSYFVLDEHGNIISLNLTAAVLFDTERSQLVSKNLADFISESQNTFVKNILRSVIREKRKASFELSLSIGDKPTWVNVELKPDSADQNCLAAMNDITERKEAEVEKKLVSIVYGSLTEAIVVLDENDVILEINPAFTRLTGYDYDEIIGEHLSILRSDKYHPSLYQDIAKSLEDKGKWSGEIHGVCKDGTEFIEWLAMSSIYDESGEVTHRVATFADIQEKKTTADLVVRQANFDTLTGLPNRQLFHDRLNQYTKKASRDGNKVALLSLDIDKFKDVNDTLGHQLGDELLVEASVRIRNCIRDSDSLARLGGDEFSIIMSDLDELNSVEQVGNRVLKAMSQPFSLGKSFGYVSVSIGVAIYPDDANDQKNLIRNADNAMYEAKREGRNRIRFFTPIMQEKINRKLLLNGELRKAIEKEQLYIAYQPIIDIQTGYIHKAEALLRWEHPELGDISPAEFIPIAEESDQIVELGDWVFYQVANQALDWRLRFQSDFKISVNKSPAQFLKSHNQQNWLDHLKEIGLQPNALVVEITEGLLLDASEQTDAQLLQLSEAGVDISLDDFGTGYSSLSYLKKFHVDFLKIDKTFIHGLSEDSDDMALCQAIIAMAHKLKIKVIAEGVETEEQRELLIESGCDYGQGRLFSNPISVAEFEKVLAKGSLQ